MHDLNSSHIFTPGENCSLLSEGTLHQLWYSMLVWNQIRGRKISASADDCVTELRKWRLGLETFFTDQRAKAKKYHYVHKLCCRLEDVSLTQCQQREKEFINPGWLSHSPHVLYFWWLVLFSLFFLFCLFLLFHLCPEW